ncbi:MAG TPA: VTT domain-containing protein [Longimicrobiaceae bacterium]|nr:VTT domain-containing protein [Longimicrobiaceae bacterium]
MAAEAPALAEPPAAGSHRWKKVVLGALVVGSVVGFFVLRDRGVLTFETLKTHRDSLLAFTRDNYLPMLVGAAVGYTVLTALSFPGGLMMSLAVGLLFGTWVGSAVVVAAATVGATLAFLSARYLFADAARRRMGPQLQRLARGFHEDAFEYMLFVRLVPVFPFWLMNLVPAFTPVSTRTFFVGTFLGVIPGTIVYVNLGARLADIASAGDLMDRRTWIALTLLALLALVPIGWKKLRPRRKEAAR